MHFVKGVMTVMLTAAILMPDLAYAGGGGKGQRYKVIERHVDRGHHIRHHTYRKHQIRNKHSGRHGFRERPKSHNRHNSHDDLAALLITGAVLGGLVAIFTLGHDDDKRHDY